MAVDPQVGARDQVVVRVAEAGRRRLRAVARVGAAQAGREMRDRHGLVPTPRRRLLQRALQPRTTAQSQRAHGFGVERLAMTRRAHHALEVRAGAQGLGAAGLAEQVEIAPAHGAAEADAPALVVGDHGGVALEHPDAQRIAEGAQVDRGLIHVATVELVVAGHEHHRHRPAGELAQAVPAAIDVACEDQQLRAGRGLGHEGLGFEVEVGQDLQAHRRPRIQATRRATKKAARAGGLRTDRA